MSKGKFRRVFFGLFITDGVIIQLQKASIDQHHSCHLSHLLFHFAKRKVIIYTKSSGTVCEPLPRSLFWIVRHQPGLQKNVRSYYNGEIWPTFHLVVTQSCFWGKILGKQQPTPVCLQYRKGVWRGHQDRFWLGWRGHVLYPPAHFFFASEISLKNFSELLAAASSGA